MRNIFIFSHIYTIILAKQSIIGVPNIRFLLHILIVFFDKQTTCWHTITELLNPGMNSVKMFLSKYVQSLV